MGTLSQNAIKQLAEEVIEEIIAEAADDFVGRLTDRGADLERLDGKQRRVLDFLAEAGDFVADIEVKYGVPKLASPAMKRLVSQVRSMKSGSKVRRVLLLFKEVDAADMKRLRQALKDGRAGEVEIYHGGREITEFFRDFFRSGR